MDNMFSTNICATLYCGFGLMVMLVTDVRTTDTVAKKYGCVLPKEPFYGTFVFNDRRRSLSYVCDEGYFLTGSFRRKDRKCRRGRWSGNDRDCLNPDVMQSKCPKLRKPNNGDVIVEGRDVGKNAYFTCDDGFVLEGSAKVTCQPGHRWDGRLPVCSSRRTVEDFANHLKATMIDSLSGATTESKSGAQSRLSPGKSGLDIVLLVDTSSSIGKKSLKSAKKFMKLLVDLFGVSSETTGGKNGTRFALVSFSNKAKVEFNLDDKTARSKQAVKTAIDKLQNTGGGTNFRNALREVMGEIHIPKIVFAGNKDRIDHATRAIFLITDAQETSSLNKDRMERIRSIADNLKKESKYEIFSIGVGKDIDKSVLAEIASTPHVEHVFLLSKFKDLERVGDIIAEKNIDYGQCGISGKTEISQGQTTAEKGAWPWLGWMSIVGEGKLPQTCGGAIVCDRWFLTAASCVSEVVNNTVVPFDVSRINLHLSDHMLYKNDHEEVWPRVTDVLIHDNYTGISVFDNYTNEKVQNLGVREYDVALLDLGENQTMRPVFNKYLRPLCVAADNETLTIADAQFKAMLSFPDIHTAYTAGWGNAPDTARHMDLLFSTLQQNQRPVQKQKVCRQRYPGLDQDKFFCVGDEFIEGRSCVGDIGGPYMVQLPSKRYYNFGLALNTRDCDKRYHFSIFLNLLDPSISEWLVSKLEGCNRVEDIFQ